VHLEDGFQAMNEERYRLIGSTASPYAIKLRALLRYRRIPFDWVVMTKARRKQTEHLRPNLIPVLQYPDGTFRCGLASHATVIDKGQIVHTATI
jgi:glutathione S-transferase